MIKRLYVEKRAGLNHEARALLVELRTGLLLHQLTGLRIINRYDVEGLSEAAFEQAVHTVFSEPPVDTVSYELKVAEDETVFAIEFLPGQFDQRADSAMQCIQMQTHQDRPMVKSAKVYALTGALRQQDVDAVKRYLINPVEMREAMLTMPATLKAAAPIQPPPPVLSGFRTMQPPEMDAFLKEYSLSMDMDDLRVCMEYFKQEDRDPTLTEVMVLDTYWSDHCRHTTFLTHITDITCEDPVIEETLRAYFATRETIGTNKPVTLMDVATIAAKALGKQGLLQEVEESEEVNACTIRIQVDTKEGPEDWLLLFKNETHNHPTEIEPFGGAATCIGGAIRDPLSARGYVYAGMRITGAADPTLPIADTLPGKLPQRQICTGAAAGFSSYGNQIGVPTGCVREIYHPGFAAKRMECGAVLGAAKADYVRKERPAPLDVVILVGGRTGRDGCGGASGSSVAHTSESVNEAAAQVQKGNAPEERKLQRLFLNPEATLLIKRCNDFGAGGVSVAIGELADGLAINLDKVPVKYEGLSGTELAISESQERMAVVCAPKDAKRFLELAAEENLEATVVAEVTENPRLVMRHEDRVIVDLARSFLNENGARKETAVHIKKSAYQQGELPGSLFAGLMAQVQDLNGCSQQGLVELFDSTIGAATVLFPLGGKHKRSLPCAMVQKLPVPGGTNTASFMSFGYNPYISAQSPYHGGYLAVVEAVSKLIAAGAPFEMIYLTHQEYFPRLANEPARWGMPLAALLGAYRAQMGLSCAAIGGKDSMSGSFEHLDVPPTLISFAVTAADKNRAVSPEFKDTGHTVRLLKPLLGKDGLPTEDSLKDVYQQVARLLHQKKAVACATPAWGGIAYALFQMSIGNMIGLRIDDHLTKDELFADHYGAFILEMAEDIEVGVRLGYTQKTPEISWRDETVLLDDLLGAYDSKLKSVYPVDSDDKQAQPVPDAKARKRTLKGSSIAKPKVIIPSFPGTNSEVDSARAFIKAGADAQVFVIRNLKGEAVAQSIHALAEAIRSAQMLFIPGGFSGGDEPDGSCKFITALLRSAPVMEAINGLIHTHKGLVGGICNGFQALVKTGLLPLGEFAIMTKDSPTLTQNLIGRHQSQLVNVRVTSTLSPWFSRYEVGQTYTVPISNREGRFLCSQAQFDAFSLAGQVAAQYANADGQASMDIRYNPSGSAFAIEALTSPDGRIMGRMGHSERMLDGLYKNLPTSGEDPLFLSAVDFFV
ncbi:MAG: phosphoribosylformylglycinamidine synthase [Clostridiales bacterium]|nr:phosphoribosylformylglycinamidine synthase [Clostridiales bacterium]